MLKFADPNDVWFHVNDMSSAHVYLQMRPEWTIGTIPGELLADCGQLVKANSIEGTAVIVGIAYQASTW
jgi:predicted ribosome quality control (RQC) complex YloA/Tae2 family protein